MLDLNLNLPFPFTRGREAKMGNEEKGTYKADNGGQQETKGRWENQMAKEAR